MSPLINPGPNDGRLRDRRLWIAGLAMAMLAVAVAGTYWWRAPDETRLAATGPVLHRRPSPPTPGLDTILAPGDRLPGVFREELGVGDLLQVLGFEAERPEVKPLAEKFQQAFIEEPATRTVLEEFKQAQRRGERPKASDLMTALRRLPEFKALVSQFVSQPGSSAALAALSETGNPALRNFILWQKKLLAAAGEARRDVPAGGARDRLAATRSGGVAVARDARVGAHGSALAANPAGAGGGPTSADKLAMGYSASLPPQRGDTAARDVGRIGGDKTDPSDAGGGGGSQGTTVVGSGSAPEIGEGHETVCTRLTDPGCQPGPASSETMDQGIKDWLRAYGIDSDLLMVGIDDWGMWGSCFAQNLLEKCDRACNNPPNRIKTLGLLYCRRPSKYPGYPYFAACIEWKGENAEAQCLRLCKQQPPCQNPPDVIAEFCGSPELCAANRQNCEGAGLTCSPEEKPCGGKTGILASDCQSLDDPHNDPKGYARRACDLQEPDDACRWQWVRAHEREVGLLSQSGFLNLPEADRKRYLDKCGQNWIRANAMFAGGKNPATDPCPPEP